MPSRRPRPTRATWALLVAGLAAAGVLLPSAARADDGNPLAPVTDPVQSVVGTISNQGATNMYARPSALSIPPQVAGDSRPGLTSRPSRPQLRSFCLRERPLSWSVPSSLQ